MQSEDYLIFADALSGQLQDFVKKSNFQYLKVLGNFISIFQEFFFFFFENTALFSGKKKNS